MEEQEVDIIKHVTVQPGWFTRVVHCVTTKAMTSSSSSSFKEAISDISLDAPGIEMLVFKSQ